MASRQAVRTGSAMARWAFGMSGYNQVGLRTCDMYDFQDPVVIEALRRCPQHIKDEREYRVIRAIQCSLTHTILPKEQWTTFEEDVLYLKPYMDEVKMEFKEKEDWNKRP